jgi:putative flippase GtrA
VANLSQYASGMSSRLLRTILAQSEHYKAICLQLLRFGAVGVSNVTIDLLALNILLLRFPTRNPLLLLVYNTVAYMLGALNSFLLNKYWTFRRSRMMMGEVLRFAVVNVAGIFCNDALIWLAARALHPLIGSTLIWANASKLSAVAGTAVITYCGMRFWVFTARQRKSATFAVNSLDMTFGKHEERSTGQQHKEIGPMAASSLTRKSLSVVLPAYNEEAIIAITINQVLNTLSPWLTDFEVIIVNDGSHDSTRAIVAALAATDPRVRLITHEHNQGYGAALVSGFEAASKELTFFMDSDGQFDIADLATFFPLIEHFDAVLGYRQNRQDTWIRKLNAACWKLLITLMFGISVRDIDCAFKLFHTSFFRHNTLETRGAMINVEMLYKLKRDGCTSTQVGVHHLPRTSGKATGAKLSVILRAFRELFTYAQKWHTEERKAKAYSVELK